MLDHLRYFMGDNAANRNWWDEAWTLGIKNPADRNFVVEDTEKGNRIVAFSRWMVSIVDAVMCCDESLS